MYKEYLQRNKKKPNIKVLEFFYDKLSLISTEREVCV